MGKNKIKYRYYLLLALLIIVLGFIIFPKIPYLNLFIYYAFDFILFSVLCLLLKFKMRPMYTVSIILLTSMGLLTLMGKTSMAERMGTPTFLLLFLACLLSIKELIKK